MDDVVRYFQMKYMLLTTLNLNELISKLQNENIVISSIKIPILPYDPYSEDDIEYMNTNIESNISPPEPPKGFKRYLKSNRSNKNQYNQSNRSNKNQYRRY